MIRENVRKNFRKILPENTLFGKKFGRQPHHLRQVFKTTNPNNQTTLYEKSITYALF